MYTTLKGLTEGGGGGSPMHKTLQEVRTVCSEIHGVAAYVFSRVSAL